jgi:DNA modification methylase
VLKPTWSRNHCHLYHGHVLDVLRQMPAASVHACVTSPPYYGLRDYGTPPQVWDEDESAPFVCTHDWGEEIRLSNRESDSGSDDGVTGRQRGEDQGRSAARGHFCKVCGAWYGSFGLEPTPKLYVQHLTTIFREVRRVLRADGTCWVNMGDGYAANWNSKRGEGGGGFIENGRERTTRTPGFAPKQLIGMPWRLAFALQADGWWLRQDIIWAKPNPMPESVTDRCTKAHEYLFLLTKAARYYYDAEAIKEDGSENPVTAARRNRADFGAVGTHDLRGQLGGQSGQGLNANYKTGTRNKRSVWTVPTRPYEGAHFAVFPPDLIRPCILAGASEKGCCPTCGAPIERIVERRPNPAGITGGQHREVDRPEGIFDRSDRDYEAEATIGESRTAGWRSTCECQPFMDMETDPVPCVVLDPFAGSGTTGEVCVHTGRGFVGVELNAEYVELAKRRIGEAQDQYALFDG